jgi:chitin disaccharide deacetylase
MKRLIVTADDVGLHRSMTEGTIRAHIEGIVTACSVVANGAAFEHAVERLRDVPALAVGVHLALVEERPLIAGVPSLVGANDLFHESYAAFVPRYVAGRIQIDEVEREFRAQIEKLLQTGLKVTHANGHQHLHLLPRIFEVVQSLAEEYSIPYVRIVDEPRSFSARGAAIAVVSRLGRRARSRARVRTNDCTIGVTQAGHLTDPRALVALLDHVDRTTELVCHPGIIDADLQRAYDWGYEWNAETHALCDSTVRDAIASRGIALVSPATR